MRDYCNMDFRFRHREVGHRETQKKPRYSATEANGNQKKSRQSPYTDESPHHCTILKEMQQQT